jgi:hypothetical protein
LIGWLPANPEENWFMILDIARHLNSLYARPAALPSAALRPGLLVILISLFSFLACSPGAETEPELLVITKDLYRDKNQTYTYVRGTLEDCRNLSVRYLDGDIKGRKTFGLQVDVMRGNILDGSAKINVLHGDIVGGKGIVVNLLIGEDFTGEAKVLKQIDPAESEGPRF